MKIKAVCKSHPNAPVLLLEGTVKWFKNDVPEYVGEDTERAIGVELDERNLYCTAASGGNHEVGFEVSDTGWQLFRRSL